MFVSLHFIYNNNLKRQHNIYCMWGRLRHHFPIAFLCVFH